MKFKYYILLLISFMIGISNVGASSIDYNLTIDNNLHFHENIVYKVNENELDTSGNYDFMTSIVNDKIYFDNDKSVPYAKTKNITNGMYTVTLKNDYAPLFLTGSRIINECFSKINFKDNQDTLSAYLESPFYCLHRADSIKINITTDLSVNSSNADFVNGNVYTWNVNSKNFNLRFSAGIPELENDPMEDLNGYGPENSNENESIDEETVENTDDNNQEKSISIGTFIVIGAVISIISVIAIIILKAKKKKLNQI